MPRLLVLFLDGVGLGDDDAVRNPFVSARMPTLRQLLDGRRLVRSTAPFEGRSATLLALDPCLGVEGPPQSASGQATILTGRNVPAEIGSHYGPKPNPPIADILGEDNLFRRVLARGGTAALLNAYPPRYFQAIRSRRRLYSAIPLAADAAGLHLMTAEDLQAGQALSADFTGEGWAAQPDFPPAPVLTPAEAGRALARLSGLYDLTWFDYWPTDYAGHRGTLRVAVDLLHTFDGVLGGLVEDWSGRQDLILLTSDHGNLEDLGVRGHTRNPVPALLIGPAPLRQDFASGLRDLTHIVSAVMRLLYPSPDA
jgi:hypothetical protein